MYTSDILSIFNVTNIRVERLVKSFESKISIIINRERRSKTYIYNAGISNIERSLKKEMKDIKSEIRELLAESLINIEDVIDSEYKLDYDRSFVSSIYDSVIESIDAQLLKMANIAIRLVRVEVVSVRREKKIRNSNLEDAFIEIKKRVPFVEPEMYFRDKSSRKWRISKYFTMLVKYLIYTFAREMVFEMAVENDIEDLEIYPTGDVMEVSEYDALKEEVFHPNSQKLFRVRKEA